MDLSHGLGYAIMIAQVILLDLALGADNSAIIGMAAKNLDHKLRKKAILIGTAGAVIARFVLAVVATYLMQIPFLKTVGAVILLWIGMGPVSYTHLDVYKRQVFYCPLFFPSFPLLVLCDTMSVRYCLF